MTDIPIIFSSPMVRALLADRKTMTRRLAWGDFKEVKEHDRGKLQHGGCRFERRGGSRPGYGQLYASRPTTWQKVKPGDRLWVRENALYWVTGSADAGTFKRTKVAAYQADKYELEEAEHWTPCIHMERRFSRLTLIVEATKIEPVQSISDDDAFAEGVSDFVEAIDRAAWGDIDENARRMLVNLTYGSASKAFSHLWMTLHGEASWDSNPEVVAPSFRVVKANIDTPEARAA